MEKNTAAQFSEQAHNTWGFDQLLEHIDIGILVLDLEHCALDYCNAAFFDILQDDPFSRDYQGLYDMFVRDAEALDDFAQIGRAAHQTSYQGRLFGYSVYRAGARYRCVFIRDITEKTRLESIAEAVNTMDNIGFIFSGIRHEIGNPLNSLKMALSVLRQNVDRVPSQTLVEYIDRSLTNVGRMEYLLKALKSFSMHQSVELKKVSLVEFMDRFISLVERDFDAQGIRIRTAIPLNLEPVLIDEQALHQALLNVFTNAAEALKNKLSAEISISAEPKGALVRLTVADNGEGISAEQMKYLFQPFNTSKAEGNGLGLVISRKLLALMDSDIELNSQPGEGVEVVIRLPLAQPLPAEMKYAKEAK